MIDRMDIDETAQPLDFHDYTHRRDNPSRHEYSCIRRPSLRMDTHTQPHCLFSDWSGLVYETAQKSGKKINGGALQRWYSRFLKALSIYWFLFFPSNGYFLYVHNYFVKI